MRFFKSKFFILCLVVAILLTLVPTVIAAFGGTDLLRSFLGTVAKPFTMCASGVANAFNGFVDTFTEFEALKAEIRRSERSLRNIPELSIPPYLTYRGRISTQGFAVSLCFPRRYPTPLIIRRRCSPKGRLWHVRELRAHTRR